MGRKYNVLRVIVIAGVCVCFPWCQTKKNNHFDLDRLIEKYSRNAADSLRLMSASFLKQNIGDLTSQRLIFYDLVTGKEVNIHMDTISGEESFKKVLHEHHLSFSVQTVPDSTILTNEFIEDNIDRAIAAWNRHPWSRNATKDIFLNYLLPYKVLDEYPEDWRGAFSSQYQALIDGGAEKNTGLYNTEKLFEHVIRQGVDKWFLYNQHFLSLAPAPSFSQLMSVKKGDCVSEAYLYTYVLRSLGVPVTVDIIPFWGSKNGTHVSEVFLDSAGRLSRGTIRNPAKVIRLTFKRQNVWRDSILPVIGDSSFLFSYLQHNHWIDVTHEHTSTTDIHYTLEGVSPFLRFAYICVFSFGKWRPVFWGKVNEQGKALFRNMGCGMLYQVAIPQGEGFRIIGRPFIADCEGNISYKEPDLRRQINMRLNKIDNNEHGFIMKPYSYQLTVMDRLGRWEPVGIKKCIQDSVLFFNDVPDKAFYRLIKVGGKGKVERIFSYEHGQQVWW